MRDPTAWALRLVAILAMLALVLLGRAYPIASDYERSIANVLVSEGGEIYTNHPADPGGPTKYGITLRDVRAYIKPAATAADVRDLTRAQALSIYHDKYWMHPCVRADALPAGLDYSVFDYGVNAGVARAGKVLRRLLSLATDDCRLTDGVLKALGRRDPQGLIRALGAERRQFYERLIAARPSSLVFRNGWMARAQSVEAISLRMAGAPPAIGLFGEEIETAPGLGPGRAWLR